MANIYESISAIMEELKPVGKNSETKNTPQKYKFRGIDDVMNALKPLLAKHKVFVVPTVLEHKREERISGKGNQLIYSILTVKHTYYAEDGSSVESIVIGEGMDTGDKASNKALSIAFKYSLFQTFCIPTDDMEDPDRTVHEQTVTADTKISDMMVKTIEEEMKRTGYNEEDVAGMCGLKMLKDIPCKYYKAVMDRLKQMPSISE